MQSSLKHNSRTSFERKFEMKPVTSIFPVDSLKPGNLLSKKLDQQSRLSLAESGYASTMFSLSKSVLTLESDCNSIDKSFSDTISLLSRPLTRIESPEATLLASEIALPKTIISSKVELIPRKCETTENQSKEIFKPVDHFNYQNSGYCQYGKDNEKGKMPDYIPSESSDKQYGCFNSTNKPQFGVEDYSSNDCKLLNDLPAEEKQNMKRREAEKQIVHMEMEEDGERYREYKVSNKEIPGLGGELQHWEVRLRISGRDAS